MEHSFLKVGAGGTWCMSDWHVAASLGQIDAAYVKRHLAEPPKPDTTVSAAQLWMRKLKRKKTARRRAGETLADFQATVAAHSSRDHLLAKTPLHCAAEEGHVESVAALLAIPELRPNIRDALGSTALHCVIKRSSQRFRGVEDSDLLRICELLSEHVDLELPDGDGRNAYDLALASPIPELKAFFEALRASRRVLVALDARPPQPFLSSDFEAQWASTLEQRSQLVLALFGCLQGWLFVHLEDPATRSYLTQCVFPLSFWPGV